MQEWTMEGGGGATLTMDVIEEEEGGQQQQQQQQEVMARPPPPPPPPEQQMTRITTCEKHPDVPVIGLCALCLRERLVDLEASRRNNNNADSSSSASAILKSIFFRTSSSSNNNYNLNQQQQQRHYYSQQQQQQQQQQQRSSGGSSSVLLSQLRRCKSFSAGRRDGSYATPRASTSLEPQRRSCDVRGRNTLWSLFHQDDIDHHLHHPHNRLSSSSLFPAKLVPPTTSTSTGGGGDLETDRSRNLGFPPTAPVPESKEEEEDDDDDEEEEEEFEDAIGGKDDSTRLHSQGEKQEEEEEEEGEEENRNDTIGATEDDDKEEKEKPTVDDEGEEEDMIVEEEEMDVVKAEEDEKARRNMNMNMSMNMTMEEEEEPTATTKKPPAKDLKEIAGSFWLAASVFSKKLRKWRQKQKLKKQQQQQQQQNSSSNKKHHQQDIYFSSSSSSYKLPSSSSLSSSSSLRPPRGSLDMMLPPEDPLVSLGRRSCDVIIAPPRFSLDAGRMSLDDPWDEPRASWDGYLVGGGGGGGRPVFARQPHFFHPSVSDDNTLNGNGIVQRSDDGLIPVEEDHLSTPGGALQAHDYYADFNRRGGGGAAARRSLERSNSIMVKRASEENGGGSARVSFELGAGGGANDPFHYSSTSLRGDDRSESFDSTSYNRDPISTATTTTTTTKEECHTLPKKSRRRWSKAWNLWGFIHRGRSNDHGRRNAVGRSMSETWPHEFKVDHHNRRMLRSNSSSWRRSSYNSSMNAAFGGLQSNGNGNGFHMDMNGGNHWHSSSKKRRDGSVFERNRSTRYSPANNADSNGMLRFYLPPMRSGRHGAKRSVREGFGNPNAFPRSVLQLY